MSVKHLVPLLVVLLLASACSIDTSSNYTLAAGARHTGDLFLPSANVTLEEGSTVQGSVLIMCCNVIADGEIDGDLVLVSGNLDLGPRAVVGGDVSLISGNLLVMPGATIGGTRSSTLPARLVLALVAVLCVVPLLLVVGLAVLIVRLSSRRRRVAQSPSG